MYHVYLAGPITGCTFGECTDWRKKFTEELTKFGVKGLSPMRGKDYLAKEEKIWHDYPGTVLSCQKGIMTRDFFDCTRSDAVIVNLLGATIVSIGTVMEIAWAFAFKKPVIAIMEENGNIHDHPMIREAIGFRVATFEAALQTAQIIFGA